MVLIGSGQLFTGGLSATRGWPTQTVQHPWTPLPLRNTGQFYYPLCSSCVALGTSLCGFLCREKESPQFELLGTSLATLVTKAGHSLLLHFGIFGTLEGKTNRQGRKPMKFGANELQVVEFQRAQNPKLHPPTPIWDLDARVPVKQRICLHWDLASRREMKLDIPVWGRRKMGGKNSATLNLVS
ncbi:hypothetical protein AVEN_54816-1 [Araneus ventricosus]|uniref:Uncharacterized protein n=1 Tax=Araneus ventricosus TaxID=182803 RepID=A0A4Y2F0P8_ARAVE|nr:hypothetical protein AVEN_54816-1 [Araneus ventricosus]